MNATEPAPPARTIERLGLLLEAVGRDGRGR